MFRLFSALILLSITQLSFAATDFLNLQDYQEGDKPAYGENIIVRQDEQTGEKWITGTESDESGTLKFNVNLSGDFEIIFEESGRIEVFLISDDEVYKIRIDGASLYAGNESAGSDQSDAINSGGSKNEWKLSVANNIAKLYANDIFSKKVSLKADTIYTQLFVRGIGKAAFYNSAEELYSLKVTGSTSNNTTTNTTDDDSRPTCPSTIPSNILLAEEFEKGKQEGTQQCVSNPSSCGISVTNLDSNDFFEKGKQEGTQQCVSNPSSCGISITGTTTTATGDCIASYNAGTGELNIPCISVPGAFGKLELYDIWLQQLNNTLN
ncbi:MAG: hypothetical protein VSS75_010610, partial [Candidatus Parabeggiatoa sp.]|nr:hypothetical protein [Candidatus Parabeggiatoa sp.]